MRYDETPLLLKGCRTQIQLQELNRDVPLRGANETSYRPKVPKTSWLFLAMVLRHLPAHNQVQMQSLELTTLIDHVAHLLWVIARHDVDNLSQQRHRILRELCQLEVRAAKLNVSGLYEEVVLAAEVGRRGIA